MERNRHTHSGRALRIVLAGSALLLAAKSAGLAADGLGAFEPEQAIVFDGSTAAKDIFVVALKNDGFVVELLPIGFVCPEVDHVSPGGFFALIREAGVFTLEREIGQTLLFPAPSATGPLPPELEALESDCELLEAFPALEGYLLAAGAQAQFFLFETQTCRSRVRNLYCQVVAAIEDATTLMGIEKEATTQAGVGGYYGKVELGEPAECPGVTHLAEIPAVLDHLAALVGFCENREAALAVLQAEVVETAMSSGGLTPGEKQNFLAQADAQLGHAEKSVLDATAGVAGLNAAMATLTEESLEASCAECGEPSFVGALSGAVKLVAQRQAIGRFVGAFQSAANQADDPQLAARLAELAARLSAVPNERVLQVIFPSGSGVGQHLIAVRPSDLPDDGQSPLVVLLTALESGAPSPVMNGTDIRLLFEHVRLFEATLARERGGSGPPR